MKLIHPSKDNNIPHLSQGVIITTIHPPPQKSNKGLIIAVIAVVAVVVIAALAVIMLNSNSGSNAKTLWNVVKEYDTNHDGKISESEFEHASFTDYKPGDTIHIKDVISTSNPLGGIVVHTFTQEEVDDFYRTFLSINPSINFKAGDTYTFFVLQSVWEHSNGSESDPCSILSIVGLPGNLTGEYHPGDSIEFTTTVHSTVMKLSDGTVNIELTEANIMGFASFSIMGSSGPGRLTAALTYNSQQSNDTKAVLNIAMSIPPSADFQSVKIALISSDLSSTESTVLDSEGRGTIYLNGAEYDIRVVDLDGDGMLSDGDMIVIDGNGNTVSGLTVILYISGFSGNVQMVIPS